MTYTFAQLGFYPSTLHTLPHWVSDIPLREAGCFTGQETEVKREVEGLTQGHIAARRGSAGIPDPGVLIPSLVPSALLPA